MSLQKTSDYHLGWLLWLQLAVPIIALGLAWAATGFDALADGVYSQAAYHRAENGWETDNPEHVIAAYTIWLVAVTGLLALFTALLFLATFALFKTAAEDGAKALEQTRELFTAERRPWIAVDLIMDQQQIAAQLTRDRSLLIGIRAENTGLSPAVNVRLFLNTNDAVQDFNTEARARLNRTIRARMTREAVFAGMALFPGKQETLIENLRIDLNHILPAVLPPELFMPATIPGFVFYESASLLDGRRARHWTPAIFDMIIVRREGVFVGAIGRMHDSAPAPE